eukprot:TRINITY_DN10211_c0_g1_i1.p1 TRINITY_DN10211_c0_g1~~TRINITY_DN10211_c0_g1_i1.p1  ORF type:complete len:649 (+),score=112.57 TRINITY_DN10211_c0_g1_i1:23-1969(+)
MKRRASTADLWGIFLDKLEGMGSSFADVSGASEAVVLELFREMGFTALEQAKLQTEWRHRAATPACQLVVLGEATREHADLVKQFRQFTAVAARDTVVSVVAVERVDNEVLQRRFLTACGASGSDGLGAGAGGPLTFRRWQHVPLEQASQACQHGLEVQKGPNGEGIYLTTTPLTTYTIGAHRLLLLEVFTGKTKACSKQERSLQLVAALEDGFSSMRIPNSETDGDDAVVLPVDHCVPKFLLTFTVAAKPKASAHSCLAHPDRSVEFWCTKHNLLVCAHCVVLAQHRDHQAQCIPLDKAANSQKGVLPQWVAKADKHFQDVITTLNALDGAVAALHANTDQEISEVRRQVRELKEKLDVKEGELAAELNTIRERQAQAIMESKAALRSYADRLKETIADANRVVTATAPSDIHVLSARQMLEEVLVRHDVLEFPSYTKQKLKCTLRQYDEHFTIHQLPGIVPIPASMTAGAFTRANLRHKFTLDPANCGDKVQLSNGNLTMTSPSGGIALGAVKFSTGKHYWETRIDRMRNAGESGGHVRLGLATEGANLNTHLGAGDPQHHIGVYDNVIRGRCHPPDKLSRKWTPGRTIGFLLDMDSYILSVYVDKLLDGSFAVPPGEYYPAFSTHCPEDQLTLCATAELPQGVTL